MKKETNAKIENIKREMRAKKRLMVAFSGGVDSGVVAKLAFESIGKGALAVIADSETLPRSELEDAKRIAEEIGIPYKIIRFSELDCEDFVRNPPERCYHCRKSLATEMRRLADRKGIRTIADGINASDSREHRPGIRAATEEGFWHPLAEHGLEKEDVRAVARAIGLSIHEKPSMACLSSRIPYGETVTKQKLRMIELAEKYLAGLGFSQVRVRAHGGIARIEVGFEEMENLMKADTRALAKKFKSLGFKYVTLDLEGYRSGSMDEVL